MDFLVTGAKSVIAMLLLVAGGAKLADVTAFAATMRLFLPWQANRSIMRPWAFGIALGEVVLGTASLSAPSVGWLNLVIFALTCMFVCVAAAGYILYRGRSCSCFGALSQRKFDGTGVLRSLVIAAVAGLALPSVPPAAVQVSMTDRSLLGVAAVLIAGAALAAARSLAACHATDSRLTAR